ncbi:M64 family metallopeptidase [Flavitalea antarctica]
MLNFDYIKQVTWKVSIQLIICTIALRAFAQVFPAEAVMNNGNRNNRINLVYLGDGYQASELETYLLNVKSLNDGMFAQTPFAQYKNYFNAYAIKVVSQESGAQHPGTAFDEALVNGQPLQPVVFPNNFFKSTFDFGSLHRLLVPLDQTSVYNVLANNFPDYDQAFIMVNSPYYGGSGGVFATASTHPASAEIGIHEIGHSFASLADEYARGSNVEAPNLTRNNDPATVRWKSWLGINDIGVYPIGTVPEWYRPHQFCKMQVLNAPFCSVCSERLIDRIHELVSMVDSYTPVATSFTVTNNDHVDFSVSVVQNDPSTITINWYLNGSSTPFAINQTSVSIPYESLKSGNNSVQVVVIDNTALSKSYLPGIGYINSITWNVDKPVVVPVQLKSFNGKLNDNEDVVLEWEIKDASNLQGFELEKARNRNSFSKLATIEGVAGKVRYTFTDMQPFKNHTYYRLKIIEKNGNISYSNEIKVKESHKKFNYKVYQDPGNRRYHLSCSLETLEKLSIRIFTMNGVQIFKKDLSPAKGRIEFDIDLSSRPAGTYLMTLQFGDLSFTVKLVAK